MLGLAVQFSLLSQGALSFSAAGAGVLLNVVQEMDAGFDQSRPAEEIVAGLRQFESELAQEDEFTEFGNERRMLTQILQGGITGDIETSLHVLRHSIVARGTAEHPDIFRDLSGEAAPARAMSAWRRTTTSLAPVTLAGEEHLIHCPVCEFPNEQTHKFCRECGQPLLDVATAIPSDKRQVTMIFTDLSGFSRFAEDLPPDVLFPTINEVLDGLAAQITSEGGFVAGYWGDAVFAIFGVPKVREDDSVRAVRCALKMQQFMRQRNAGLDESEQLQLRVGINTGEVASGILGGPGRKIQTVLGNNVNIAARLEPICPVGGVAVSRATLDRLEGRFHFEALGTTQVKNIQEPVEYFQVQSERPDSSHTATRRGEQVSFVGRDDELSRLIGAYEDLKASETSRLVVVEGRAGIGKSRLTEEFLHHISETGEDIEIIKGQGEDLPALRPYRVMVQALRRKARIDDDDPLEDQQVKLRNFVRLAVGDVDELEVTTQVLGNLMGISFEEVVPQLQALVDDPERLRERTYRALQSVFEGMSRRKPLLFLMEDLHWTDRGTILLAKSLLESLPEGRIMVLGLGRPEFAERCPELLEGDYAKEHIVLPDLSDEALIQMFDQIVVGDVDEETRRFVVNEAGGNPFIMQEMARAIRDGWRVARDKATQQLQFVSPDGGTVPVGAQSFLAARVAALPREQRTFLQAASVIGESFSEEEITALHASFSSSVPQELMRQELIFLNADGEYEFSHAMLRDTVYASLPAPERRRMHTRMAEELVSQDSPDLPSIASHYEEGGNISKAAEYYHRAARDAFHRQGANQSASHFYEKTHRLSVHDNPELALEALIGLNEVEHADRDYEQAMETINSTRQLVDAHEFDNELRGRFYNRWGMTLSENGETEEAIRVADEGLRLFADDELNPSKCLLLLFLGRIHWKHTRSHERSREYLGWALELATALEDDELLATAYMELMVVSSRSGDYDASLDFGRRADALLGAPEHVRRRTNLRANMGATLLFLGQYEEAFRLYEEAAQVSRERLDGDRLGIYVSNLATVARLLGHERTLEYLDEARELHKDHPYEYMAGPTHLYRALFYVGREMYDEAEGSAREALHVAEHNGDEELESWAHMALAQAYLGRGLADQALEWSRRAYAILEKFDMVIEEFDLEIMLTHARILQTHGLFEQAWEVIAKAKEILDERADRLQDEDFRDSFKNRVKVNFAITQLWEGLRREATVDRDAALQRVLSGLDFAVPPSLPDDIAGFESLETGTVSEAVPIGDSHISGVLLDSPIIAVLKNMLTRDITVPKNTGDIPQVWAEDIRWRPFFDTEGAPSAFVEFALATEHRWLFSVITNLTGMASQYRVQLKGGIRQRDGVIRLTMKLDEGHGNLGPQQFGEIEFILAPTKTGKTVLALRMQDRLFTKNPDVFLREFIGGIS